MIFSIQSYIQDCFHGRGLLDNDGYAIKIANLYFHYRLLYSEDGFFSKIHKLHTTFYSINGTLDRKKFESNLLDKLDKRFLSSLVPKSKVVQRFIDDDVSKERNERLTIRVLLERFVKSIERKGVDVFWTSRKRGELRKRPEEIASNDLCIYVESEFIKRSGIVLSEIKSGIGYIDVGILISKVLHIVELKIVTNELTGVDQLIEYLLTEEKKEGFLVIFDARDPNNKGVFPSTIMDKDCKVNILVIDINPRAPSKLN